MSPLPFQYRLSAILQMVGFGSVAMAVFFIYHPDPMSEVAVLGVASAAGAIGCLAGYPFLFAASAAFFYQVGLICWLLWISATRFPSTFG